MLRRSKKGKNKCRWQQENGIGPTYTDKISRTGLRVGDILDNFKEKYEAHKAAHLDQLKALNYTDFDITENWENMARRNWVYEETSKFVEGE